MCLTVLCLLQITLFGFFYMRNLRLSEKEFCPNCIGETFWWVCSSISLWLERSKASTWSLVTSLQNSYSCPLYHIAINRRRKVLSVEKGITTAQSLGTRWESAYLSSSPHFTYPWMSLYQITPFLFVLN